MVPIFPLTSAQVYVKLDLARHIHVPCAELCNPDDVRSESSDQNFIEKSDISTVYGTKVTQLQHKRSWTFVD